MHFHGHHRVYTGAPDEEVCNCIQVERQEIRAAIDEGGRTVGDVGDTCGAGGGCGECHEEIARMLMAALASSLPDLTGLPVEDAVARGLGPLAAAIGAAVRVTHADEAEVVLTVDGDANQRQTIALWAEQLIDPLLGPSCFLEVE